MKVKFFVIFGLFFCLSSQHAYAYLDPGSGSLLVQALIAVLAGIGATTTMYWRKLKSFFKKITSAKAKKK